MVTVVTIRTCFRAIARVNLCLFLLPVFASFNYLYLSICICICICVIVFWGMKLLLFLITVLASSNYFTLGVLVAWTATALPSIRWSLLKISSSSSRFINESTLTSSWSSPCHLAKYIYTSATCKTQFSRESISLTLEQQSWIGSLVPFGWFHLLHHHHHQYHCVCGRQTNKQTDTQLHYSQVAWQVAWLVSCWEVGLKQG